jgi:hypothetical protein
LGDPDRAVRELEASGGKEESRVMDGAAGAVGAVAEGVARVADGVANFAAKGIEFLADFFGGASAPPPTREQGQDVPPPAPEPSPPYAGFVAPSKPQQTIEEFLADELAQRQSADAQARDLAAGRPVISEAEFNMLENAKNRDRGGGQSL